MTPRQLANVLIKILGLSVCLRAIPAFLSNLLGIMYSLLPSHGDMVFYRLLTAFVGVGIEVAIGIFFILKSREITEFLFKGEDN